MTQPYDFRLIQPDGILSASVAKQMLQEFETYQQQHIHLILIDLQNVSMIDSFGLGIIVSMHNKLKLAGGKLYLCGLQNQARFLFDISALDRLFDILPDQQAFHALMQEQAAAV
jgi:anti-sigma B factor antagonist